MCGQGGVAGTIGGNEEKIFQFLLIYNSTRGLDSTGAGSVKRYNVKGGIPEMVVAKEIGNPFELLSIARKGQHDFSDVLQGSQRALLGHCRAKTIGAASRKNAHPFRFDHIMGTHNGTLSYQTQASLIGEKKFETDSEALYFEIEERGIAEAIKKMRVSDNVNAVNPDAYALVWYNAKENSINLLRNKERPLWYCFDKDRKRLFWSSDKGHLYAATHDTISHEENYLYNLPIDTHFSWVIPEHDKAFGKARAVKREGSRAPLAKPGTSIMADYHSRNASATTSKGVTRTDIDPWGPDEFHGFFMKYDNVKYRYRYAVWKHSQYYDSLQEVWDSLSELEQNTRITKGIYPSDIDLRPKFERQREKEKEKDKVIAPSCDIVHRSNHPDLEDSLTALNGVTQENRGSEDNVVAFLPPPKKERKTLSANEVYRHKKMEERLDLSRGFEKFPLIWGDETRKVYYSRDSASYIVYTWKGFNLPADASWRRDECKVCPDFVPFTDHDIEARHFFRHKKVGSKKNKNKGKVTSFVGYLGSLLVRESFDKLMEEGCLNCQRKPKWGNWVRFVSDKFFFCEHCERDEELVNGFKTGTKN